MKHYLKTAIKLTCIFLSLLGCAGNAWGLTETAREIYERSIASVYQIRVIDINSGEKSVIGSGFKFSNRGLIATNYHVISDAAAKPERYRIEYYKGSDERGKLTLEALDAARDLAILKGADAGVPNLSLQTSAMSKGDRVFPLGNPHDLGMTIKEGMYNGLVGGDLYKRILISASLNRGMSGGPAFNSSGEVIGVNVSIRGNDLSYLVPAKYLEELAAGVSGHKPPTEWQTIIQAQVLKKYDHVIHKILKAEWSFEKFGSLRIPNKIASDTIKCWGQSKAEDIEQHEFYSYGYRGCHSEESVYLSSSLRTGKIGFSFLWLKSARLNPLEFYQEYSKQFAKTGFMQRAVEKDVEEPLCKSAFVKLADRNWKTAYCVRQYKKYPDLNDIFVSLAVLGEPKRGHIIRVSLTGINEKLTGLFLKKLLGGIKWAD